MTIKLNDGQLAATQKIDQFLASPVVEGVPARGSNRYFSLQGGGGTGKSTSVFHVLEPYREKGCKILLCAPTNKAVRVLAKMASAYGVMYDCSTLHSALGLAVLPNEERKSIVRAGKAKIGNYDIVVVDEASMCPSRALDILEDAVVGTPTKILFMGDPYQLPPVMEQRCEAFDMGDSYTLTKVERYSGPILTLANQLRTCIDNRKRLPAIEESRGSDGSGVEAALGPAFVKLALDRIDPEDTDKCRMLAWTNRRVDELNHAFRQHCHGKKVPQFIVGDRVVTTDVVKDDDGNILLPTDEECVVKAVEQDVVPSAFNSSLLFPVWTLVIEPLHSQARDVVVHVLHRNHQDEFYGHLREIAAYAKKTGDWGMYWEVKESVHQVKHCYAITVHRSQGSTFGTVFLDVIDIQKQKVLQEQLKLLYVGATRPANELYVNRKKFIAV